MSANNQLRITRDADGDYEIYDRDVEGNSKGILVKSGGCGSLEGAIRVANEYREVNEVEYVLYIDID